MIFCVLNEEMGREYKIVLPYWCILTANGKAAHTGFQSEGCSKHISSSTGHAVKDHFNDFKWQAQRAQF